MASALIHIAVASKINKKIKRKESEYLIGSIAPDIAKIVGIIKIIPPIVGVPDFLRCDSPTYSLIFCPKLILFKTGII